MHDYNHQLDYFDTTVTGPEAGGGVREEKGGGGCMGGKELVFRPSRPMTQRCQECRLLMPLVGARSIWLTRR